MKQNTYELMGKMYHISEDPKAKKRDCGFIKAVMLISVLCVLILALSFYIAGVIFN